MNARAISPVGFIVPSTKIANLLSSLLKDHSVNLLRVNRFPARIMELATTILFKDIDATVQARVKTNERISEICIDADVCFSHQVMKVNDAQWQSMNV